MIKISGDNVSIAELTDFICAAQMARESSEFITDPEEQKVWFKEQNLLFVLVLYSLFKIYL